MGGAYTFSRDNVAQSTTDDTLTVIPATARQFDFIEMSVAGMGVASAANSMKAARSSGGTTGGGALTGSPHREKQAAFAGTNFTTWAAQPTLGPVVALLGWNANGGLYRWVRIPGDNITFVDGDTNEQLSFRGGTGTSTGSFHFFIEEF